MPSIETAERAPRTRRPPALRPGDTVALVAPSGPANVKALERGVALLDELGLVAHLSPLIGTSRGYLAGASDVARAASLEEALLDSTVSALWCARGGYGATRLLRLLDWQRLRRQARPKLVCGYSDITALHQALRIELGWSTLHGPIAQISNSAPLFTVDGLRRAWFSTEPLGRLELPPSKSKWDGRTEVLVHGTARGTLVGGNLSLLAALCGTPWALQARDGILLLEDVHEAPYRIDRMIVQLLQAGCLEGVQGIVFGHSPTCEKAENAPSLTLIEVLVDLLAPLGIPLVYGWPLGHTPFQWTVPLGVRAELDTASGALTVLEPACAAD